MKSVLLIADSDSDYGDFHRSFFADHGYQVEVASDGLDCLAQLRRHSPVALILDRDLPWGGADGVLARMREEGDVPIVPVVLTSTLAFAGSELVSPPVFTCLLKPFSLNALVEAISAIKASLQQATVCDWFLSPKFSLRNTAR